MRVGASTPLETTLLVDTSLADGGFRMTISIPFDLDELNAAFGAEITDPCAMLPEALNLMWLNPATGCWENTVSGKLRSRREPWRSNMPSKPRNRLPNLRFESCAEHVSG